MGPAILIDGAFFLKRFRRIGPSNYFNAQRAADAAWRWVVMHLKQRDAKKGLYRIFFYDCPPLEKQMRHPSTKQPMNFQTSAEAAFRHELHEHVDGKRSTCPRPETKVAPAIPEPAAEAVVAEAC
jgi:hypothetical protein